MAREFTTLDRNPSLMKILCGSQNHTRFSSGLGAERPYAPRPELNLFSLGLLPWSQQNYLLITWPTVALLLCPHHMLADFLLDNLSANNFHFHKYDISLERELCCTMCCVVP